MDSNLTDLIKKSLETFDDQNTNATELIQKYEGRIFGFENPVMRFNNENFIFEILGVYDPNTKVWIWSWAIPIINPDYIYETSQLFKYGLTKKIIDDNTTVQEFMYLKEDKEFSKINFYIKTVFLNSRILINNNLELEILLAISSYILGNRIRFIFKEENTDLVYYYLIK